MLEESRPRNVAVITISRQLGSLGTKVAQELADRLGYRMVWREVINKAAARSAAPEVALAMIDDLDLLKIRPSYRQRKAHREAVEELVRELADKGEIVIVGRAGQVILRDRPDVLHVRIIAPRELRIRRIAAAEGILECAARERMKRSDKARLHYVRRYYHVIWNDPALYDLVINTAHLSRAQATRVICQTVAACRHDDLSQHAPVRGPAAVVTASRE